MSYTLDKLSTKSERYLEDLFLRAKDAYYNVDKKSLPIMSDGEFDILEEVLRNKNPNNKALKMVGPNSLPVGVQKVSLPVFMGSLPKIKPDGSADKFIDDAESPFIVSDKLDGNSVLLVADAKCNLKLYSRGKGSTGFDISVLISSIKGIGRILPGEKLRGELVILNEEFNRLHADDFQNPRNLVGGIVNRAAKSNAVHKAAGSVILYVHTLYGTEDLHIKTKDLEDRGFTVVRNKKVKNLSESSLLTYITSRKSRVPYDMDGLVVTDATGKSIAFKMDDESAVATVDEVLWNPSRYGFLKPTVRLREPVRLAGVDVEYATAHNAKMVVDNGIGPGCRVRVIRSGEVVPKLVGVIKPTKPSLPEKGSWKWNESKVDIVLKDSHAASSQQVITQKLSLFLIAIGVEGVKGGLVSRLVDYKIDSIIKLVRAKKSKLREAGLGPVQAKNLHTGIKRCLTKTMHPRLMWGSGIFKRGWGIERFETLLDLVPYKDLVHIARNKGDDGIAEVFGNIKGFGPKLAKGFSTSLLKFDKWVIRIGWTAPCEFMNRPKESVATGPLSGTVWVFSGIRSKEAEKLIVEKGGTIGSSIKEDTTHLVLGDINSSSIKAKKAKAFKTVKILSFNDGKNIVSAA